MDFILSMIPSLASVFQWWSAHSSVILAALFFISEALGLIPGVKANSVFQLVFGWLQKNQPQAEKK